MKGIIDMENYTKVEVTSYVKQGIENTSRKIC